MRRRAVFYSNALLFLLVALTVLVTLAKPVLERPRFEIASEATAR